MPGKRRKRAGKEAQALADPEEDEEADEDTAPEASEKTAAGSKKRKKVQSGSSKAAQRQEVGTAADDIGGFEDDEEDDDEEEEIIDAQAGEQDEDEEEEEEEDGDGQPRIFRPGIDEVQEGEQLDHDPGTYNMLHRAQVEWPCLSFDVVRDDLGASRTSYPMTAYVVAGSQAEEATDNRIYMMKWSNLRKTAKDGKEDSDDEEDEDSDDDSDSEDCEAVLDYKGVMHPGGVNRIRCMPQACHIVATWSDTGKVHMWNLEAQRKSLDKPGEKAPTNAKPIFTSEAHKEEGFALDWSPHATGKFLSGSNDGLIFLWEPVMGGWKVQADNAFRGHTGSVEDLQWKRSGVGCGSIFASVSSDKSARVWDIREQNREKCAVHIKEAHGDHVNVLSWNPCVGELLATAGDDGGFKVWDTRNIGAGPMANFNWHKKPICSIDWHPTDETTLVVASEDHSVSLWDMAVEDDREGMSVPGEDHYPAQLMFLHMGQQDPKEVRWHPQLPGVCISTAGSGFNIFKTCNI